jgi:hypothetical protein
MPLHKPRAHMGVVLTHHSGQQINSMVEAMHVIESRVAANGEWLDGVDQKMDTIKSGASDMIKAVRDVECACTSCAAVCVVCTMVVLVSVLRRAAFVSAA